MSAIRVEPLTAYAVSKVVAEAKLADLADSNFIVTNLRFATAVAQVHVCAWIWF